MRRTRETPALVPPPRLNLTRFHGVFAPNSCPNCGGSVKVIASIEDPPVIERILRHFDSKNLPGLWSESRAPPGLLH